MGNLELCIRLQWWSSGWVLWALRCRYQFRCRYTSLTVIILGVLGGILSGHGGGWTRQEIEMIDADWT